MNNYFSSNLKHLRIQNGLTQSELAKKLGKDYSTIGKWELGQRSPVMLDVIRISELFDISLEKLINSNIMLDNTKNNEKKDKFDTFYDLNKHLLTERLFLKLDFMRIQTPVFTHHIGDLMQKSPKIQMDQRM